MHKCTMIALLSVYGMFAKMIFDKLAVSGNTPELLQ